MAIDKSNTKPWVKVTLIVLIVAFVMSFVVLAANPWELFKSPETTTGTPAVDAVDSQYQPQVASLTALLQSEPESYTVLVTLGNAYFDWAAQKQQASQTSTSTLGADLPLWNGAKDAYARAIAVQNDSPSVSIDYAITLFYTGDSLKAIETAEKVTKETPEFSPAWFNLGIFFQTLGENPKAITAFERYLKIDPKGTGGGSPDFATEQLKALQSASTETTTP